MNAALIRSVLTAALIAGPVTAQAQAPAPMAGMDMGGKTGTQRAADKPGASDKLSLSVSVKPNPPRAGDNALDITVTDSQGKPVSGLKLTASVAMTSMDMGTTHPPFTDAGKGHYTGKVTFSMAGPWRVVLQNQGKRLVSLDFNAGGKTHWSSPQLQTGTAPTAPPATMPGMDMGEKKTDMGGPAPTGTPSPTPTGSAPNPEPSAAPKSGGDTTGTAMPGMDMGGKGNMGGQNPSGMVMTGIADMKTATVPLLQEKGTYTATGTEDWKAQTGFGHNAGMVGMMNQMMVGGSGMEGMKMPAMSMKFDEQNYAKPDGADSDTMPGMDMGGAKPDASGDQPNPPASAGAAPTVAATLGAAAKAGDNALSLSILDGGGKPVAGAKIELSVAMTSMDMGTSHPPVKETGGGKYASTVTFSMAGPWRVTARVTVPGQKPVTKAFDFTAK